MGRTINLKYEEGATPLDLNEIDGLIPQHISTQSQLNQWEQINIYQSFFKMHGFSQIDPSISEGSEAARSEQPEHIKHM